MKKFVSMALALTVAASMAVPAFAASEPVAPQNEPTAATESVSPCIYWTGTAKLNTTDYVNITSITINLDRKAGQPVRLSLHLVPKLQ